MKASDTHFVSLEVWDRDVIVCVPLTSFELEGVSSSSGLEGSVTLGSWDGSAEFHVVHFEHQVELN